MDKVQQHIQTVREALKGTTVSPWKWSEYPHDVDRKLIVTEVNGCIVADCEYLDREDAHLIANAPTWLQTSIDLLEQQQREIERLREALGRIANYCHLGESFHASITRCIKIAAAALSPKEDQTPPEMGMTRSDRSQIDDLIKEYGADFILDYVNDYAEKEVLGDVQDDRKAD